MPEQPPADDAARNADERSSSSPNEPRRWGPPMDPPDRPAQPRNEPAQPNYEHEVRPPMAWPADPARPVPGWEGPHPWVDPGAAGPWWGATTASQPAVGSYPPDGPTGPADAGRRPAGVPPMFPPEQQGAPTYSAPPPGGGFGPPPIPPPPPPEPSATGGRGTRLPIAVAVVLLLLAAAAGFGGGLLANETHRSSSSGVNATVHQVTLQGDAAQPAAAVAKALSPAVVQLQTGNDLGSGFIYDPSGLVLTAAHVVGNATKIQVTLSDGTKIMGTVVGTDAGTDVAVVRIKPPTKLAVAALGSSNSVNVGETAIAIGSPFGLNQTVTQGIVSATGRAVKTQDVYVPMIQTDAPINPGNSGGALANVHGQVIGINDAIYTDSNSSALGGEPGNVGVGFAIPIDLAKTIADRLVAGQPVGSGYLGIEGGDSTGSRPGAVVQTVVPGTPAAKADLKQGDLITAIDGKPITSMGSLAAAITTHQPGETVTLTIERNGKQKDVKVTLQDRAEALKDQPQDSSPGLIPGG